MSADVPQPPAIVKMVTGGATTFTLPRVDKAAPILVWPQQSDSIRVFDQDGRLVGVVPPGYESDFEVKQPRWWQFWRRPNDLRWEETRRFKR